MAGSLSAILIVWAGWSAILSLCTLVSLINLQDLLKNGPEVTIWGTRTYESDIEDHLEYVKLVWFRLAEKPWYLRLVGVGLATFATPLYVVYLVGEVAWATGKWLFKFRGNFKSFWTVTGAESQQIAASVGEDE